MASPAARVGEYNRRPEAGGPGTRERGAVMEVEQMRGVPSIDDLDLPEVDFTGTEYLSDPLAACRAARERAWAARTSHGPLVLTHADVNELLRFPEEQMVEMDIATMLRPETEEELSSPPLE